MTVAVRVSATVTGHRRMGVREHDLVLALPLGEVTARQVIEASVIAEVAAFQARAEEASLVRVLTREGLARDLATGAVRTGGPQDTATHDTATHDTGPVDASPVDTAAGGPVPVDIAAAVDAALLAFADGLFKVFVADRELADDDAPVALTDGAQLLFLRLMPLAGG
ncbi:MAG TPA: hypothetical protein VF223_13100 [Trebonia sp.]